MNLLSRATIAYIRAHAPQAAAHLEAAGDMTPRHRTSRAPRRAVIDNRALLAIILATQNGRSGPAGDEDVIEGEWTDVTD